MKITIDGIELHSFSEEGVEHICNELNTILDECLSDSDVEDRLHSIGLRATALLWLFGEEGFTT